MTTPVRSVLPIYYLFADLTLDSGQRRVVRQGRAIELSALNFDLLRVLVESAPNVVTSEVLAEKVWGRHFVSPENVAQRVMLLRQSLADDASQPRYIETVRNKGYRLIPAIQIAPSVRPRASALRGRMFWAAAGLVAACGLAIGIYQRAIVPADSTDPPAARTPAPNSVAVLPFDNLSPDPIDGYFAVGIHDQIVNQLTELGSLRVSSRTAALRYGASQKSVAEIARELKVATILDGTVSYSGGRVRVTAHLSEGATNENLWSESYEHELGNIFAIQSDIALEVARALKTKLLPQERERVERLPTTSLPAYVLYLQAITRRSRESRDEILLAIEEVEQALELAPDFAAAWVLDSNLRTVAQFFDPEHTAEHRSRGEQAARSALSLDPELGTAHAALGFALTSRMDWIGGEAEFREARRRNVPLADIGAYALLQLSVANFAYAREILEDARAVVPHDRTGLRGLMGANASLGEWELVNAQYAYGTSLFSPWPEGDNLMMHLAVGRNELARARSIPATGPINPAMLAHLENPQAALRELHLLYADPVAAQLARGRRDIAIWAAHFGDAPLALDAMRSAVTEQGGQAVYLWLPQFQPLYRLPGFQDLLREIGIVAYWEEYGWPAFGWPAACRPAASADFDCGLSP